MRAWACLLGADAWPWCHFAAETAPREERAQGWGAGCGHRAGASRPQLEFQRKLHPSAMGYKAMADAVLREIIE